MFHRTARCLHEREGGIESFLLYRYRQECGASTLAQLRSVPPATPEIHKPEKNFRGGKLEDDQIDFCNSRISFPICFTVLFLRYFFRSFV